MLSDHRLRLRYRRGEEAVVVEVDPNGLVLKSGVWYLLAGRDGEPRTYRVSRVEDAEVLDAPCRRRRGLRPGESVGAERPRLPGTAPR